MYLIYNCSNDSLIKFHYNKYLVIIFLYFIYVYYIQLFLPLKKYVSGLIFLLILSFYTACCWPLSVLFLPPNREKTMKKKRSLRSLEAYCLLWHINLYSQCLPLKVVWCTLFFKHKNIKHVWNRLIKEIKLINGWWWWRKKNGTFSFDVKA